MAEGISNMEKSADREVEEEKEILENGRRAAREKKTARMKGRRREDLLEKWKKR